MTRRSFLTDMLKCGIATTFLPGAGRIWKPTYVPLDVLPFWVETYRWCAFGDPGYQKYLRELYANCKGDRLLDVEPDFKAFRSDASGLIDAGLLT